MSFWPKNLRMMSKDDQDTVFLTYRTNDSIPEISRSDYWREALGTLGDGDIVFAVSGHTKPLQAAQFLVAETFLPAKFIVVTKFAEAKS